MNVTDEITLLSQFPLFASLNPSCIRELAGKLETNSYKSGEKIFNKDDYGSSMYIIKSGQVKISTTALQGDEVILAILGDGDFFGELSLLDECPRSANVTALEATTALCLQRNDFLDTILKEPQVVIEMLAALSQRLRHTNLLLEDAVFLGLPTRLAKRLLELGRGHGAETGKGLEIDLHLTIQDLEKTIASNQESIYRLLGLFEDRGLISMDKHRIRIPHPKEFAKFT